MDRTTTPDGCHPWTAGIVSPNRPRASYGYGSFCDERGKTTKAHLWGYRHYIGPIPAGYQVRHTCDNPPCQNPAHWILGTSQENSDDMMSRGRSILGERQRTAKLSDSAVRSIRERYAAGGITQQTLADEYGVHQTAIGFVVRRAHWKHV